MSEKVFSIEFYCKDERYSGYVRPFVAGHRTLYLVILQTGDRGRRLELVLGPSQCDLDRWEFHSVGSLPVQGYDQTFLAELGEQVSQCLGRISPERV